MKLASFKITKFINVGDAYAICAARVTPAESVTVTIVPPSAVGHAAEVAGAVEVAMVAPKTGADAMIEPGAPGPPSKDAAETLITPGGNRCRPLILAGGGADRLGAVRYSPNGSSDGAPIAASRSGAGPDYGARERHGPGTEHDAYESRGALMAEYSARYGAVFFWVDRRGEFLAGGLVELPQELLERLRARPGDQRAKEARPRIRIFLRPLGKRGSRRRSICLF
jgi:hypothetical protein